MFSQEITLEYPAQIGESRRQRYESVGLEFSGRNEGNLFTKVRELFVVRAADIASLSDDDFHDLTPTLYHTPLREKVEEAKRIHSLARQARLTQPDQFPYPTQERPFTWGLQKEIAQESLDLLEKLKEKGIQEVKIGLEVEFSCPEQALEEFDYWLDVRREALEHLTKQYQQASDETDRTALEQRLEALQTFNTREVMMFDIIELDTRTRDFCEPLFGTSRDGNGYYDGRGVLELKLKPCPLEEVEARRLEVLKVLQEKTIQYGLEYTLPPAFHVNVSFWNEEGDIFDSSNSEFSTKGKAISEGMMKAIADGCFVVLRSREMNRKLGRFALQANRVNLLRFSSGEPGSNSGRIEIRPSVRDAEQDIAMMQLLALVGAVYGLDPRRESDITVSHEADSPIVHHTPDKQKVTSHVLSNSTIDKNGLVQVSEEYVEEHYATLTYELGLVESDYSSFEVYSQFAAFMPRDLQPFILDFFKEIRVAEDENGHLDFVFPTTNGNLYEFTVPAVGLEPLPEDLKAKVLRGGELSQEEINTYYMVGDRLPAAPQHCVINTALLKQNIHFKGVKRMLINDGYNMNVQRSETLPPVGKGFEPLTWLRFTNLVNSSCFISTFSSNFMASFARLLYKHCQAEYQRNLEHPGLSYEEIEERLYSMILDQDFEIERLDEDDVERYTKRDKVEGEDFIREYARFVFANIHNPDAFGMNVTTLLDSIMKKHGVSYWFEVENNGPARGSIKLSPELFHLVQEEAQSQIS